MYSCFSRCHVATGGVAPALLWKLHVAHGPSIRSGGGLTLETSAFGVSVRWPVYIVGSAYLLFASSCRLPRMAGRSIFQRDSKIITAFSVAFFALLGCAIRVSIALWLGHLDFGVTTSKPGPFLVKDSHKCYEQSHAAGYFFQNVLGCILMAAVARHKKAMNQHLATGLSSGLCGALTTWATWMGEVASTITNGYIFQAFVSVLCMLCVSLASYRFGHFLAGCGMEEEPKCFDEYCGLRLLFAKEERTIEMVQEGDTMSDSDAENGTETESEWGIHIDEPQSWKEPSTREVFLSDAVHIAITGLAFIYIATFLGIAGGRKYYTGLLDMSMAPFGALLRWWLSLFNKYTAPFPFFTLVANTLGCLCNALAGVYEVRVTDALGDDALAALSTGFAGSLSTVSTLVSELRSDVLGGLRLRSSYFLVSFAAAMAVLIPIDYTMC